MSPVMNPAIYTPHDKQIAAHRAVEEYNRAVLFWGRQVGKTVWALNHAWLAAARRQGRYFIIFKTYSQAKDVIWQQYLHFIPDALRVQTNTTELSITFPHIRGKIVLPDGTVFEADHDPSLPPSSIQLLGSDQADSHRGMKAHGMIFDEYADQDPANWGAVYEPMFSTTDGWAVFMSTPKGYNHWYDMVMDARENKAWFYSEATWRDNPAIDPKFIERVRSEAERRGELNTFLQEYELEFRSVENAVFPEFDRNVHVVEPSEFPQEGTLIAGIDFGWDEEHPTAVNFILIDHEGVHWVIDELHLSRTHMDEIIEQIRMKAIGKHLTAIVADSARPDYIDYMRSKGMPAIPVVKKPDSVPLGIQLIGQLLKPRQQLIGEPKPKMLIGKNCPHTVFEFEMYKYPSKKKDRPQQERPMKQDDHHPDAIRYVELHLKYGLADNTSKPLKVGPQFNEYGIL
jgi:hypothetical protein